MIRSIALFAVAALCLSGCAPEGPQAAAPMTPCQSAASVVGNPYATPGAVEMALEFMRVKCLGMTADGSKQLRPGTPLTSNRSNAPDPAMGGDDIILGRAVP
jgi:hypothetical protein